MADYTFEGRDVFVKCGDGMNRRGFLQTLALSAASLALLPLVSACSETENTGEDDSSDFNELPMQPGVGSVLNIGGYTWEVLSVGDHQALLITEHVIALRAYTSWTEEDMANPDATPMSWSECDLAKWLNREFLDSFSPAELERIIPTSLDGEPEEYRIFCLSPEAVEMYMPTEESRIATLNLTDDAMEDFFPRYAATMADPSSAEEQARIWLPKEQGEPHDWWVRYIYRDAPGYFPGHTVSERGNMNIQTNLDIEAVGVRPALWLSVG